MSSLALRASRGVCSHAPGITGRAHLADPALRDPFHAAFRAPRRRAARGAARRADPGRRRALRQLLHGQHAGLRDRHGRRLRRADRGPEVARHREDAHPRQRRPRQAHRHRGDGDGRRRLRRGVEVRPRHHRAAALPDAALRPAGDSGQHQLPGPAADAAASRLGLRRGAAPRRRQGARADRDRRHRRHQPLAGDARLREDQRGLGPRLPGPLAPQRQGRPAARTPTPTTYREAGQGGFEIRTFVCLAAAARGPGRSAISSRSRSSR